MKRVLPTKMTDLNIYRVNVIQEWVSECDAIVLAPTREEAETVAEKYVDFNIWDAEDNGTTGFVYSNAMSIEAALELKDIKYPNEWFIAPRSDGGWDSVTSAEFFSHPFFSPEELERARIASIEKNNGQIDLPLIIS